MSNETIKVGCPGCKSKLKLTRQHLGIDITCPKCQTIFRISARTGGRPATPPSKPAAPQTRQSEVIQAALLQPAPAQPPVSPPPAAPDQGYELPELEPEPAQTSYWQPSNYSGAAADDIPQTRAEKLQAAQQRQKEKSGSELGYGSDWLMRTGGAMILLSLLSAGLPFFGLELMRIKGPIMGLFVGIAGCVMLGFAFRDNLMTAIGSAGTAAVFVVGASLTSYFINYYEPAPERNVAQAGSSSSSSSSGTTTKPAQSTSNPPATARTSNLSRADQIIEQNKKRSPLAENPFRDRGQVATTSPPRDTSNKSEDSDPFSNFEEAPKIAGNQPSQSNSNNGDDSNPFAIDDGDDSNPFSLADSGNSKPDSNSTTPKVDEDNPFALPGENPAASSNQETSQSASNEAAKMDEDNPFAVQQEDSASDDDNPFADKSPPATDQGNPFSTGSPGDDKDNPFETGDSDDGENPFAIKNDDAATPFANGAADSGPLTKMSAAEEEELFNKRPNSGARLERGVPVDESMLRGKQLTNVVGKKQRIGLAMLDGRPVIGLAWGKSFGRSMIMPIYQGDQQFAKEVRADPGYFLAGVNVGFDDDNRVNGIQAVFAKPASAGQLDMQQTKRSAWLGVKTRKSLAKSVDPKGNTVYGLSLQLRGLDILGVGLVVD